MKLIDKLIGVFSPEMALKRELNRQSLDRLRKYEAATSRRTTRSYSRAGGRASDEVSRAHKRLAGGAQDLVRNNALAKRAKKVIAANVIGTGIKLDFITEADTNKRALKAINQFKSSFDDWAETTECDAENHNSFYGLQHLWAMSVVESGGVFIRQIIDPSKEFPLVLQTIEQQYLDTERSTAMYAGNEVVDGIEINSKGQVVGYWLFTKMVGDNWKENESQFYSSSEIIHIFDKERAGQHLGVSWYHAVADLIDIRQEWRDATLQQQRIAACFGVIVKNNSTELSLERTGHAPVTDGDGNEYSEIEAGMIAYIDQNADVTTITPPNLAHTTDFNSQVIQDISVGLGVTREQLTNDFSQVTWASGRLARGEFYSNLDVWQTFILTPALNKILRWFKNIYTIQNGEISRYRHQWVMPVRSAVNPKEDLDVDIAKVRTAAMTPQQFSRKHGIKFEDALAGWQEAKKLMGDMVFDFDPEKFSLAGNQIVDKNGSGAAVQKENDDSKKKDE